MTPRARFLAITGTTASGKTDLSLALAQRMPIEVISMDSRQVYATMDIGTDKVDHTSRDILPHHGLDLVRPDQRYSAGQFARDVRKWIDEIEGRGAFPVLVGGTGFFLRAVTNPIFEEPDLDQINLKSLRGYLAGRSREELERFTVALDPERAPVAIMGGPQRMSRTIEVALLTGVPLSRWHRDAPQEAEGLQGVILVLDLPRDELYRRIDVRVDRMVERGLLTEVQSLLAAGYSDEDPGMSGTGYREISTHLRGDATLEDAVEHVRRNTRRYARRQITWFRNQLPESAIWIDATMPVSEQVDQAVHALQSAGLVVARPNPTNGD
jgi:tRNA dimethylallyltransferase